MKTTIYNWNGFEDCKPNDGDLILIKDKESNSIPRIIQYHYGTPSIELFSKEYIVNLENYKWTNLDNNESHN